MRRIIDSALERWRSDPDRRVLLIRGARQVGKTFSVRALGSQFEHYVEINFERMVKVRALFEGDLDAPSLCRNLSVFTKTPIVPGKTLLFFDEIQACPAALRSLRFFYEQMPQLHTVATGSLLEFALTDLPSFGVGRIETIFMYPMTFTEFLWSLGEDMLAGEACGATAAHPLAPPLHDKLLDLMRTHQMIGGMPAVVEKYRVGRDALACQIVLDNILLTLRDDFAKYARRTPVSKLSETFSSVAYQAGGKFMITRAAHDSSIASYRTALDLLVMAGLVHTVHHTAARGVPLAAQINEKKYKAFLFDAGIHQRVLGLDLAEYVTTDTVRLINEGSLAEIYAGIELVAGFPARLRPQLFYWHREARASNAEVDYVISRGAHIVPIEVKARTRGGMKSMGLFLDEGHAARGIRLSAENFSTCDRIDIMPLYAAGRIPAEGGGC